MCSLGGEQELKGNKLMVDNVLVDCRNGSLSKEFIYLVRHGIKTRNENVQDIRGKLIACFWISLISIFFISPNY